MERGHCRANLRTEDRNRWLGKVPNLVEKFAVCLRRAASKDSATSRSDLSRETERRARLRAHTRLNNFRSFVEVQGFPEGAMSLLAQNCAEDAGRSALGCEMSKPRQRRLKSLPAGFKKTREMQRKEYSVLLARQRHCSLRTP